MNTYFIITMSALILWEVARMLFAKQLYAVCKEYASQRDSIAKRFYMEAHPILKLMLSMDVVGLATCIIGLFTAYWYIFLFTLILSFIRIKSVSPILFSIDAALTVILYGMVLIDFIK